MKAGSYVVALALCAVVFSAPVSAAPAHDDRADAMAISALPFTHSADTTSATTEVGEGAAACTAGISHTVWYVYTAVAPEVVVVNTDASDYDTVLQAFVAMPDGTLSNVACDDDGGTGLRSHMAFEAVSGMTYFIQAGSYSGIWGGSGGNLVLAASSQSMVDYVAADPEGYAGKKIDAAISVVEGVAGPLPTPGVPTPPPVPSCVDSDDPTGAVGGSYGMSTVPAPNDDIEVSMPAATPTVAAVTCGATEQSDEPLSCGWASMGKTVWFAHTATADGPVTIDTFGSNFDTVLAVYTGTGIGDLSMVGCNDDSGSLQSSVSFDTSEGTTYYVQVGGYSSFFWGTAAGVAQVNFS